jgi:hypothetical protein
VILLIFVKRHSVPTSPWTDAVAKISSQFDADEARELDSRPRRPLASPASGRDPKELTSMTANIGYAAPDAQSPLAPMGFDRPAVGPEDVRIEIKRVTIGGPFIGSIAETQEVLDFSAEHHVDPEIRIIDADSINDAFDDIADNDVAFRYVIDNSTLPASGN